MSACVSVLASGGLELAAHMAYTEDSTTDIIAHILLQRRGHSMKEIFQLMGVSRISEKYLHRH